MVPPVDPTFHAEQSPAAALAAQQEASEYLSGYLECLARRWEMPQVPVEVYVTHGHPAETILQVSEAGEADLLVLTTHGGGLARGWLDRVALKVAQVANRPVLLIRSTAPEEEDRTDENPAWGL